MENLHTTYSPIVALQAVKMRTLQYEIAQLPRIIMIALLAHPAVVVRSTNLFKDALASLQFQTDGSRRLWRRWRRRGGSGSRFRRGTRPFTQKSRIFPINRRRR